MRTSLSLTFLAAFLINGCTLRGPELLADNPCDPEYEGPPGVICLADMDGGQDAGTLDGEAADTSLEAVPDEGAPDASLPPCQGEHCNGCPPGTVVPEGFVCVPAGTFVMGSPGPECPGPDCIDPRCDTPAGCPGPEPGRGEGERQRRVTISRPFLIGLTEVTQRLWVEVMGSNPSTFQACGLDCPVETVNWFEAVAFCNALSARQRLRACFTDPDDGTAYDGEDAAAGTVPEWPEGAECEGYRLPTDAEWEYAARAGTFTAYWSGEREEDLARVGWYSGNSGGTTHPVGEKAANGWGLRDVHGNVWEWVADDGTTTAVEIDPVGGGNGRSDRGGSAGQSAPENRLAWRNGTSVLVSRWASGGLRIARPLAASN